ncbi:FxsA family protein [Paracoccus tegillarcae]|uniref:Exclusion protein FxsA n=1 Tax=Paracoccus tegillarcae TaxID=1529068 RepID=A0A2K9EE17_9RHOB|nr:FxsA family protein [Paracoccus tegillarcae]AUH33208.1 exclusion protein FxsA [Paracoccus tegillarcae]
MWLFILFIAIPLIEIGLFIQVGGLIGLWPTLAVVLLTAVIGTALMRSQGSRALAEIQRNISEFRDPSQPMAHGAMILFAGALLLTPGFFTDATGLLLLIPGFRTWALRQAGKRVKVSHVGMGARPRDPHRPPYEDGVIDADYVVEPEEMPTTKPADPNRKPSKPSGWTQH